MPGSPQFTPPPWIEADSIRETTLYLFDSRKDRAALRRVGRLLKDLALEATRDPGEESETRAELRAAAADLRYTGGYLSTSSADRPIGAPWTSRTRGWPTSPASSPARWPPWSRRSNGGCHDPAAGTRPRADRSTDGKVLGEGAQGLSLIHI